MFDINKQCFIKAGDNGIMPRKPLRDWLTTDEAAQLLKISVPFMRVLIRTNKFPHSELIGRTWLHYRGDVEKLKAEREKHPPHPGRQKSLA